MKITDKTTKGYIMADHKEHGKEQVIFNISCEWDLSQFDKERHRNEGFSNFIFVRVTKKQCYQKRWHKNSDGSRVNLGFVLHTSKKIETRQYI